ncbi:hypothetical protein COT30_03035 [Candidatus Micrarchaeota archaeon CG08_land_8_20_14_0_20_49_17]|nr:MAG: hypothetical protein COT30_03035 [Candidatus Micrarchaeota archaeon CG08_land_8_20_14_0_20_49_17]PIU82147.1 MAG: hypothetical protein COS70_02085 [Candidatus Micrarchaeota archaeon CG06_land_8_20_14_3_00_50_6]
MDGVVDIMIKPAEMFSEFGLTNTESKILEALISMGQSTGSGMAKRIGTQKSVAYFVLDRLVQKGLAGFALVNNRRQYQPIEPELLKLRAEERKKSFSRNIESIISAAMAAKKKRKTAIFKIFEGWDGMKIAFDDILSIEKEYPYLVFAVDIPEKIFPRFRRFIKRFHLKRSEKKIGCRLLISEKLSSTIGKDRKSEPYTDVRFVSSETAMPMAANIYKNKVLLAVWSDPPLAITIESREISDSFAAFFELLWKNGKK